MESVLCAGASHCCSASLWPSRGPTTATRSETICFQEEFVHSLYLHICSPQDRATFRRLIVKNNAKKRRMYECFIESVPLLKSLEVSESHSPYPAGFSPHPSPSPSVVIGWSTITCEADGKLVIHSLRTQNMFRFKR